MIVTNESTSFDLFASLVRLVGADLGCVLFADHLGITEMTRKDYELIARVLSDWPKDMSPAINLIVDAFCVELANNNPAFDADKFRKAIK